jgi:hypothetical protein
MIAALRAALVYEAGLKETEPAKAVKAPEPAAKIDDCCTLLGVHLGDHVYVRDRASVSWPKNVTHRIVQLNPTTNVMKVRHFDNDETEEWLPLEDPRARILPLTSHIPTALRSLIVENVRVVLCPLPSTSSWVYRLLCPKCSSWIGHERTEVSVAEIEYTKHGDRKPPDYEPCGSSAGCTCECPRPKGEFRIIPGIQ